MFEAEQVLYDNDHPFAHVYRFEIFNDLVYESACIESEHKLFNYSNLEGLSRLV